MARPRLAIPQPALDQASHLQPALQHLSQGEHERALGLLLDLRWRYPHDPLVAEVLGMAQYDAARYGDACASLGEASVLAGGASGYLYNEGSALLLAGQPDKALSAYVRSLRGDEIFIDAHRWAWSALAACGKLTPVLERFRAGLREDARDCKTGTERQKVPLDDVTLCAIDCVDPSLAIRSLRRSMKGCSFGAAKLLTSRSCRYEDVETVQIPQISSKEGYSRFVMKDLARYVDTAFTLVTQWDGYVVNPGNWCPEFLQCDYIGATWDVDLIRSWGETPAHIVGNGGFSLRSKRLLAAGGDRRLAQIHPEDAQLCRRYRPILEAEYGIRYADAALADQFSFEANLQPATPFGFHGAYNIALCEPDPRWIRFEFAADCL